MNPANMNQKFNYCEGAVARLRGVSLEHNPFTPNFADREAWAEGWIDADKRVMLDRVFAGERK